MARFEPLTIDSAEGKSKELLKQVQDKMGKVPNLLGTMAHSPAVLEAYLGMSSALANTSLSGAQREAVALGVSQTNECGYCTAAHTAIGKMEGLDDDAAMAARDWKSDDAKTQAALDLGRAIVEKKGFAEDDDVQAARDAGLDDAEILEVVAVVAQTTFTNYVNHLNQTEVDFPQVPEKQSA